MMAALLCLDCVAATCSLSDVRVSYRSAEVVRIFDYIHRKDIIYRDLKPENVMLDSTYSGKFLCQPAPTLFRPFLAHFCSFFPRFFAVLSILPPRFRKPAPRPGKTVRNGRKTAGKNPQVDINIPRSRYA